MLLVWIEISAKLLALVKLSFWALDHLSCLLSDSLSGHYGCHSALLDSLSSSSRLCLGARRQLDSFNDSSTSVDVQNKFKTT